MDITLKAKTFLKSLWREAAEGRMATVVKRAVQGESYSQKEGLRSTAACASTKPGPAQNRIAEREKKQHTKRGV